MPKLFQRFNRGTGLGLYVAKNMITAHGGQIWAESEDEGKGARFVFRIPMKEGKVKTGFKKSQ